MIDNAAGRRFVRTGRRWAKKVVDRFFPPREAPRHRPSFEAAFLARRLGIESGHADDERSERDQEQRNRALGFAGARAARSLFGDRFFVDPPQLPILAQQLEDRCPGSRDAVLEAVKRDSTLGIPLYAGLAPPLGAEFPWAYLPPGPGGDSMYIKRPHRFAFAPCHAWASLYESRTAGPLLEMLESWMRCAEQAESPMCYDSNLAVIQRILALSWTWAFLAGRPVEESDRGLGLEWRILQIIEADVRFLEPVLGQSKPNNHLLADWFAGWYLRVVFPEFLDQPDNGDDDRWCRELLAQTYADGGSFEHSTHYHEFACEMGVAYLLLARRNSRAPDSAVEERVKALLAYQCALNGPECHPLPLGNAVEDTLFPLDLGEGWCSGALREYYRALVDASITPPPVSDTTVPRAFWLLGGELAELTAGVGTGMAVGEQPAALPARYDQAGLYVLADKVLDGRLVFRSGPSPETAMTAGHAHSDLLAVYLNFGGQPLLVDSGTFTYRRHSAQWGSEPPWRAYFAGPEAHNGFCIPGEDPLGNIRGDFRSRAVPHRVAANAAFGDAISCVEGSFLGVGPYKGMRRACVHVNGEYWLILNLPPDVGESDIPALMRLQFSPSVQVLGSGDRFEVVGQDSAGTLYLLTSGIVQQPELLCGSRSPLGGWVSPRYGELRAAPQLRFVNEANTPSAFLLTSRQDRAKGAVRRLEYHQSGGWFVHIEFEDHSDWMLLQTDPSSPVSSPQGGPEFDGRMLQLRTERGRPLRLNWLEGSRLDWPEFGARLQCIDGSRSDVSIDATDAAGGRGGPFSVFEWPDL